MRFFSPLLILVALLAAACGGTVLPDEFTRERADGKIPVSIPLIRQQTQKEIGGMPEGQAKVERWQQIEKDHNQCRLLSARSSRAEANEVFAACMSKREYVYMHRLDAEQLHDDIAAQMVAKHKAAEKDAQKAAEEERVAAEKRAEEERQRKEERIAAEKKRAEEAERVRQQRDLNDALIAAVKANDTEQENQLIAKGANPKVAEEYRQQIEYEKKRAKEAERRAAQEEKDSALRAWAADGNVSKIRGWLKKGANPNAKENDGWTALMIAAQEGHPEAAQMLLTAGANPNATQKDGATALMIAAKRSHAEVVKMLLAAGANPDTAYEDGLTALMGATGRGHSEVVKMLLAAGANPNATKDNGWTALMGPAQEGYLKIAKALLDAGANPNAAIDNGIPALLANALFADKKSPNGQTPLMFAAGRGHSEVVKMLLAAGANPNAAKDNGWTALMGAAFYGYPEVVKMLLAAGAKANTRGNEGATALMFASQEEKPEVAKILLECGANPDIENEHGANAWVWAKRHPVMLSVFSQYQVKIARGWFPSSCKNQRVAAAVSAPKTVNSAAQIFENVWRHIVVIKQGEGQGSGVIVRPNVVATNCHVVDSVGDIVVYKHDNRRATTDTTYNAVIRKRDTARDFCLLNVAGLQGTPAKLRRYNTLDIGEDVYAVGSPRGLDLSLSSGIISQLRQGTNTRYIQTDASVSPGSSGGGLFDSVGNLIGILTSKIVDEDVEGIGFAIPADLAINL